MKCSNLKCTAKINPNGLKNIILYKSVWKFEYLLKGNDQSKCGLAYNLNDSKYVTLEEADENMRDYEYLFLRVIKKEAPLEKESSSEFTSESSDFYHKLRMLDDFDFHGEKAISISNHK